MDELATNAGYSRSTLYNYFPGWRGIVTAIVTSTLGAVAQRLAGVSAPTIAALVHHLCDAWPDGDERALVISGLRLRKLPWLAAKIATASNRCEAAVAQAIHGALDNATAPSVVLDLLEHHLSRLPRSAPHGGILTGTHR